MICMWEQEQLMRTVINYNGKRFLYLQWFSSNSLLQTFASSINVSYRKHSKRNTSLTKYYTFERLNENKVVINESVKEKKEKEKRKKDQWSIDNFIQTL